MGRSCSAYRPLTNHQQRKFGLGRSAERHSNRARRARKFGPSPTPLEAMQNPDWRAQRHRQGRRCEASRTAQQNSQSEARPRSPLGEPTPPDEPDCCSKTAIADRAPLRRPPRRAQLRCCSAGYGAVSEKEPRPTVSGRTPELGSHHGGPDASHSGGTHSVFCCQPLPQTPPPGRPARNLAIPSCESPPAGKSYEHRRVARPARGGGDSRTPQECSFSICCPTFEHPPPRKLLRPTVSGRTLGLFWSPAGISSRLCSRTTSEIPLKAGGRPVPLGTRKLESARQHATTALPRGAACPRWAGDAAHRWGLTGEKTGFVRAPWRFILFRPMRNSESLLRRGARSSYPNEQGLPYAGGGPYAGRAVPPGTRHYLFSENFSPGRPGSCAERHPDGRENWAETTPVKRPVGVPSSTGRENRKNDEKAPQLVPQTHKSCRPKRRQLAKRPSAQTLPPKKSLDKRERKAISPRSPWPRYSA